MDFTERHSIFFFEITDKKTLFIRVFNINHGNEQILFLWETCENLMQLIYENWKQSYSSSGVCVKLKLIIISVSDTVFTVWEYIHASTNAC